MKLYKIFGILIILLIIVIFIIIYFKNINSNHVQINEIPSFFDLETPINKIEQINIINKPIQINEVYSVVDLETSGKLLAKIFKGKCILPIYNDVPLLGFVHIAGCGTKYWPSIIGSKNIETHDYEIKSRENFNKLLKNEGCPKNYVSDYLIKLSNNPEKFNEKSFSTDLSCAGKISFQKIQFTEE